MRVAFFGHSDATDSIRAAKFCEKAKKKGKEIINIGDVVFE